MNESFERIEKHLYKRQFQTSTGDWRTIFYGVFTDWKGIRRKITLSSNLDDARDKLGELRTLNKGRYDFSKESRNGRTPKSRP